MDTGKILVVDDAQFLRLRLSRLLREHGHEVVEADGGDSAVAQYTAHRPDAVLLDITMPDKDDLEVLRELRAQDPDARVIMLTALGQQSLVLEAIKSGAMDLMVKPFERDRVLAAVDKATCWLGAGVGGMNAPIRLLVVDDSTFVRLTLARRMNEEPDIVVVDTAADGLEALEKLHSLQPDVVTLDIEMPRLDGLATLRRIMAERPRPVIMLSTLTRDGARETFRALALGAVDFVPEPSAIVQVQQVLDELTAKVRSVAGLPPERLLTTNGRPRPGPRAPHEVAAVRPIRREDRVVLIRASTGRPRALGRLLHDWPADLPAAAAIVQHMPPHFTSSLADRLNDDSPLTVKQAHTGDRLVVGQALLAPGGRHLGLQRGGEVLLLDAPPRNHVRPAVDVTFEVAARWYGERAVAVVLTGMGCDGTSAARRIKAAGGTVLAEAETSCVVYGMPRSVVEAGLADGVAPLDDTPAQVAAAVCGPLTSRMREMGDDVP